MKDRNDVTFHIIGNGSEFESTKELAHKLGADKIIKFYGSKPYSEAMEYYKLCDACILTLDGSNHIGDTLPGKIQTYMVAGKPIFECGKNARAYFMREFTEKKHFETLEKELQALI